MMKYSYYGKIEWGNAVNAYGLQSLFAVGNSNCGILLNKFRFVNGIKLNKV